MQNLIYSSLIFEILYVDDHKSKLFSLLNFNINIFYYNLKNNITSF